MWDYPPLKSSSFSVSQYQHPQRAVLPFLSLKMALSVLEILLGISRPGSVWSLCHSSFKNPSVLLHLSDMQVSMPAKGNGPSLYLVGHELQSVCWGA